MNSRLFQFRYSYERDVAEIFLKVAIGASGAPTIVNGKGVVSITRNSAGKYTILLKDNWYVLMGLSMTTTVASGMPAAPVMFMVSEQVNNVSTPQLVVQCAGATDASTTTLVATDPGDGETLLIKIAVRSAST